VPALGTTRAGVDASRDKFRLHADRERSTGDELPEHLVSFAFSLVADHYGRGTTPGEPPYPRSLSADGDRADR